MTGARGAGPVLVAGVGARRGVPAAEVVALIGAALAVAGRRSATVAGLATVAGKAAEPGLLGAALHFGVPLWSFPAEALAAVGVPAPSGVVRAVVGTPSVAEAAALLAAGPRAALVVGKRASAAATCALAAPADPDSWGATSVTHGTKGAAEAPAAAVDIVVPSSDPISEPLGT
ncbi:cobalamin biosynthesis protein [Streptomyces sp. NPDC057743]|uniref:cobalamin biosynthesis protein n=1 Tax=Streptomyces sp. NPDC057743 TaxID=3346236 RepID=UPI00368FB8E7